MDDFERELRGAMQRWPAPPGLKRKVMERRLQERAQRQHGRVVWWQRLAASAVLAGLAGGAVIWHNAEQRRKGEEARRQVFTALRIANHALQQMNVQLMERSSDKQ